MIPDGIHLSLPATVYHADPAPVSLSSSILNLLLNKSPLHAWTAHPRLNPDWRPEELDSTQQSARDFGSACHALLLEGGDGDQRIVVVDEDSWRKQAAQDARAAAIKAGLIPLLRHKYEQAQEMCAAIHAQLAESEIAPLFGEFGVKGVPEATLVWQEDGVRCRARCDWLSNSNELVLDLTTTATSANPEVVARHLLNIGKATQVAHYIRGVEIVTGVIPTFVHVVAEASPPYACSLIALDPGWLEVERRRREMGIGIWSECLRTGMWPGYSRGITFASIPPWAEAAWISKELED